MRNRGRLRKGRVADIYLSPQRRNLQQWKAAAGLSFACISYDTFEDNESMRTIRLYRMERGGFVEFGRGRWVIIGRRKEGVGL